MVNSILTFINNKNIIAVECGDIGAAKYQLFWKADKEATPKNIHLVRARLQKV